MVKSLSQYLNEVNGVIVELELYNTTTTPWFRGHASADWKLTPSIFRYRNLIDFERDVNRDFKLLSRTLLKSDYPKSEFEWLYVMQHYGLPTRLLDWTESSLVGLYFAVEKYWIDEDAAIYVLNPRAFNRLVLKDNNTIPVESSPYLINYVLKPDKGLIPTRKVEAKHPLALRPSKNSKRILAQRGVFTIHGSENISLDGLIEKENFKDLSVLKKITIEKKFKMRILQELYQCGISPSVLFPELPGISEELVMKYTHFFKGG